MKFVDCHAHLTDDRFTLSDYDFKGFAVVNSGYDRESSFKAQTLSQKYDDFYFTCGIQPEEIREGWKDFLAEIPTLAADEKCVAIGECGLDYHYVKDNKELQKEVFAEQIKIAYELKKPIVIHSRDCANDMFTVIKEHIALLKYGFMLHCYSDSKELAKEYAKLGAYFSFGGVITFKNAKKEEVLLSIPKDRILSETDSPYMSPEPFRGKTNISLNIPYIVKKMSQTYEESDEQMKKTLYENACRFFGKEL